MTRVLRHDLVSRGLEMKPYGSVRVSDMLQCDGFGNTSERDVENMALGDVTHFGASRDKRGNLWVRAVGKHSATSQRLWPS